MSAEVRPVEEEGPVEHGPDAAVELLAGDDAVVRHSSARHGEGRHQVLDADVRTDELPRGEKPLA
ncbi:hypothetical protein [Streptomyces geranii]|uniref:hypothetical protein n=1 Tax=Streptomyces geranii TaxID=2058923 RepID=UPI000D038CC1|nr:hypothetical protein [Streptomyces geranii]